MNKHIIVAVTIAFFISFAVLCTIILTMEETKTQLTWEDVFGLSYLERLTLST